MIGNKVCTAIPYKTFKQKISLTKKCKDSEDEKGRKLAIGALGIAITELERIAQEVEQVNLWNV